MVGHHGSIGSLLPVASAPPAAKASGRFGRLLRDSGTRQDPPCDVTAHAGTRRAIAVPRRSHEPPATHADALAFGRLSSPPALRSVPKGAPFSVGANFDETGGNTYGGRPLYTDGHTHQPTSVSNQHLGGTSGGRPLKTGGQAHAPTFSGNPYLGGQNGGHAHSPTFPPTFPPRATFRRELHGDVGLAYTPSVRPSVHDPHHCIPAIVAPTVTSSISHLPEGVPREGQPQINELLRHGDFYPRETHPVMPRNESKTAAAMQHPTSLASYPDGNSLAKSDVHCSADSPPGDASLVNATSTDALPMGGDSLVTLLTQMQASAATTATDAATAAMAAVAADRKTARLELAADRQRSAELHHKLIARLEATNSTSTLPPLPTLTGKSDWPRFWEIATAYLSKEKYSVGPGKKIIQVDEGPSTNTTQSTAFHDLLVGKLKNDAATIFRNTGTKYDGRGFDKLARLFDAFAGKGKIDASRKMLNFFRGFDQGALSPDAYAQALREQFEVFDESGNPLSPPLQVMLALRGLRDEYADFVMEFTLGRRQVANTTLDDIAEVCRGMSSPLYHGSTPAARAVDRSGPLSKPAGGATDSTNTRPPPPPPPPNPFIAMGQLSDWAITRHGR